MATTKPVPAKSLDAAIAYIRDGGRLVVRTYTSATVLDGKVLKRFEKANAVLLKADGDGYRLARGRKFDYLMPGQLEFVIEAR